MALYDVIFVGGGLAGIVGAARASRLGLRTALVHQSALDDRGRLGGFAAFSGAKFSLYPAGTGLEPIAGGSDRLKVAYGEVLKFLGHFSERIRISERTSGRERPVGGEMALRQYHSIVLTPGEIGELLAGLSASLERVDVQLKGAAGVATSGTRKSVQLQSGETLVSTAVVVSAGRLGADLLSRLGCAEQEGKGCDLGVRLEFPENSALAGLRALGPDAKILLNQTRTFCLNSPGRIYRYPWEGISLPGGVVAAESETAANVGILRRCHDKGGTLRSIRRNVVSFDPASFEKPVVASSAHLDPDGILRCLFGEEIVGELVDLLEHLEESGLVDLARGYLVHRPLLDWHWPVFGRPGSFETTVEGVYAIGDLSGHARGLLQAATSGWLCAGQLGT